MSRSLLFRKGVLYLIMIKMKNLTTLYKRRFDAVGSIHGLCYLGTYAVKTNCYYKLYYLIEGGVSYSFNG